MSNRLCKDLYGSDLTKSSNLFGLFYGQMRHQDFVHNGGWFNQAGERMGWGDLSPTDFRNIQNGLQENELFIVLGESATFLDFVTKPEILEGNEEDAPGTHYVAQKCAYIITHEKIYAVRSEEEIQKEKTFPCYCDKSLIFHAISRENAKPLLQA